MMSAGALKALLAPTRPGETVLSFREKLSAQVALWREPEKAAVEASGIITRRLRDRLCRNGGIFVDVGAHIGSVIEGVAHHSRPGQIIAVEAIPAKAANLRARFRQAEIHQCALGPSPGEVEFTIDMDRSGYSSLDPDLKTRAKHTQIITVPMRTLDGVLAGRKADFIKIDVEGAELGVLRGSDAAIANGRPIIMFESGATEMRGYRRGDLYRWFVERDYSLFLPIRLAHRGTPATLDVFLDAHEYPRRSLDWFAVPTERVDETNARARHILGIEG